MAVGCKMQAGTAYIEKHNQVAAFFTRIYFLPYLPKTRDILQKIANNKARILCDFPIQINKQALANQPDILLTDKNQKPVLIIERAKKLKKYQKLKITREDMESESQSGLSGGGNISVPQHILNWKSGSNNTVELPFLWS